MLISFERTMRKELWKRIWWMRQGSSKQQHPKVSDNWIYSGISRCQIKEHFTALAINAKPTFFDLSLFFRTHWNYFRQKCLVLLLHDCLPPRSNGIDWALIPRSWEAFLSKWNLQAGESSRCRVMSHHWWPIGSLFNVAYVVNVAYLFNLALIPIPSQGALTSGRKMLLVFGNALTNDLKM